MTPENIYHNPNSNFYKDIFDTTHPKGSIPSDLKDFPRIVWEDIIATPFLKRLYINKRLLTKIVSKKDSSGLIGRTVEDIAKEDYGLECTRPLVIFDSLSESLEKSLWFYTRNIVPLINDSDIDITSMTATKYEIDAIVADSKSFVQLIPKLKKFYDTRNIKSARIIDSHFNFTELEYLLPDAHFSYTLALPETGTIATTTKEDGYVFSVSNTSTLVPSDAHLIVTRTVLLPTPIIQYDTRLKTSDYAWK